MSSAEASPDPGQPQRPLYRRIEALRRQLRQAVEREGVGSGVVGDIISAGSSDLFDFGLWGAKSPSGRHTIVAEGT